MTPPLHIGIIGAGTAGAGAALFLAQAGHQVELFEAVPQPGPVGAGIMLQPTGQRVLDRLGLLRALEAQGARVDRLFCSMMPAPTGPGCGTASNSSTWWPA